jgi:hypothetical protein
MKSQKAMLIFFLFFTVAVFSPIKVFAANYSVNETWLAETFKPKGIENKSVVGDFNGDGKSDIAVFYDYGAYGNPDETRIFFYSFNGTSYLAKEVWSANTFKAAGIEGNIVVGDFYGDKGHEIACLL